MPNQATWPKAAYPVNPPMMFHPSAMIANMKMKVRVRIQ